MYFYRLQTRSMQDQPEGNADRHTNSLNMYLLTPGANGKPRRVKHMNTTQLLINQEIHTTTILCCDEDEDNG